MLITNDMKNNIQIIIDTIILRFQQKISLIDKTFVKNTIFIFLYLEKAILIYYKDTKKNIDFSYINVSTNINQ